MDSILERIIDLVSEFLGINAEDVQIDFDIYDEYNGFALQLNERMWIFQSLENEYSIENLEAEYGRYLKRTPQGIATFETLAEFIKYKLG